MNPFAAFTFSLDAAAAKAPTAAAGPRRPLQQPRRQASPAAASGASGNGDAVSVRRDASQQQQQQQQQQQRRQVLPLAPAAAGDDDEQQQEQPASKRRRRQLLAPAGPPAGLPEKLGDAPLRLVMVGHNPSEHAFHSGHYYSNPSNRFWPILISSGIAPPGTSGPDADDVLPGSAGIGFTDVGTGRPGTDSSKFTTADFAAWQPGFYERMRQHMARASASIGCMCGRCGAPAVVAFTGKRHYAELLNLDASGAPLRGKQRVLSSSVSLGPQPPGRLPPGWPLPPDACEVWVLTSTSGAAPMSNADRAAPYERLAARLAALPWPRPADALLRCRPGD